MTSSFDDAADFAIVVVASGIPLCGSRRRWASGMTGNPLPASDFALDRHRVTGGDDGESTAGDGIDRSNPGFDVL